MNAERKDQFSCSININSIIAHDLRGYFSTILGYSELLSHSLKKNDFGKAALYCRIIHDSAEQGIGFLIMLLEWGRNQVEEITFNPEDFRVESQLKDVMNYATLLAAAKKISVYTAVNPDLFIFADRNMIRTVLMNLVSNAVKFCNSGGKINISCRMVRNHVEFMVTDDGVGIEPENLTKLFTTNMPINASGTLMESGTGFGLQLCKKFVELHKGKIWAKSEPGRGSSFIFTIPDGHS